MQSEPSTGLPAEQGQTRQFFATAAGGLQHLLANELTEIGAADVKLAGAGVNFSGSLHTAYSACLWSRVANRILMPIHQQKVTDPDSLYDCIRNLDWSSHMDVDQTLAVDFFTAQSDITHSQYGALKVKDAIVDQFRESHGERPSVERQCPDLRINVYLHRNRARIAIDFAGNGLHRRGYRTGDVRAPLKENFAAALLYACEWPEIAQRGQRFVDPMCGSGTLLIEAAMMASDTAPAIHRDYFGFLGWRGHDNNAWQDLLREAAERAARGRQNMPEIMGSDFDPVAISSAKINIGEAGFTEAISVQKQPFTVMAMKQGNTPPAQRGLVLFNPPYGKRLQSDHGNAALFQQIGKDSRSHFAAWKFGMLVPEEGFAHRSRLTLPTLLKVSNGGIPCKLVGGVLPERKATPMQNSAAAEPEKNGNGQKTSVGQTHIPQADTNSRSAVSRPGTVAGTVTGTVASLSTAGKAGSGLSDSSHSGSSSQRAADQFQAPAADNSMFANRLRKNLKSAQKWARKNGIHAYRLYDADMPEYAVAVDVYHISPGQISQTSAQHTPNQTRQPIPDIRFDPTSSVKHIVVQEYQAPAKVDAERANSRLQTVLNDIPAVVECTADHIHLKVRKRQRGTAQYERNSSTGQESLTQEHGCNLLVNLDDYLDTGLFLDHRKVRHYIQQHSANKRFLNLFAYTGAATAHAIVGGAASSTSVDLSARYLAWAQRNFQLNGSERDQAPSPNHQTIQADVLEWLETTPARQSYDLIFLDPPTFSNSTSMQRDWDVNKDHQWCIRQCMKWLKNDGMLIFSTNSRRFKFDSGSLSNFHCTDKSAWSIDADFKRNPKIHQCWFIKHQ